MRYKRAMAACLGMIVAFEAFALPMTTKAAAADLNKSYIALGADLDRNQKEKVLELLGVKEEELKNYTVATVTNAMEHKYLDKYLSSKVIGSKALSSVKVVGKKDGSGIKVTSKNISYCTDGMYQNALATAGVKDAEVTVAAPVSISGTAALVGAMAAYENMTGETIANKNAEAATNELVVTSKLGDAIGDQKKAEALVGAVKDLVVGQDLNDEGKIRATVEETAQELDVTLSEEEKDQLVDLMQKIGSLDLNVASLKEQVAGLYDLLDKRGINVSEGQIRQLLTENKGLISQILEMIKGWLGK